MVVHALLDGEPMSRGLASLRGYQRGGPTLGGGLAALLSRKFGRAASRLAPLFFGKRSETGYVPGVSESIYNAVVPDYALARPGQLMDAMRRIARGDPGLSPQRDPSQKDTSDYKLELGRGIETIVPQPLSDDTIGRTQLAWSPPEAVPGSLRDVSGGRYMRPEPEEDAWRTYLGLDQEYGTFREAEFRPTISSDEDIRYRDFADPDRVIDTLARRSPTTIDTRWKEFTDEERRRRTLEGLEKMISSGKPGIYAEHPWGHREAEGGPWHVSDQMNLPSYGDVMGDYTLSAGEDEGGPYISYYDKWDVAPKVGQISRAGRPFDIYGRMYYDPETYEYRGSNE